MTFETLYPAEPQPMQIAWESTLKCNLDCGYCGDGHDNSTEHPAKSQCLDTVDFIFEYVKRKNIKQASLNIQGGESLFHPNILDILKYIKNKKEQHQFYMGIAFITNAVVGRRQWARASEYVDFYTISYHAEATTKQKNLVRQNILYCKEKDKNFHVSIMMHPKLWDDCINMVDWCKQHNVKYNCRQIDHHWLDMRWNYNAEQSEYLIGRKITNKDKLAHLLVKGLNMSATGRSCCSKRDLCAGSCTTNFVQNKFKGWTCSVADNFLYIRQTTGEVFTNKDCRMNYEGNIGPIGYLNDVDSIYNSMHSDGIVCKKSSCWCGICAPKAKTREQFNAMMVDIGSQNQ